MKPAIFTILFLLFFCIPQLYAQEQQAAWQDYMTPGPVHEMMAKHVGEWTSTMTLWSDSSQPPQKFDVDCTYEMIMGGRYLKCSAKGTMMSMPFEGMMILGYDNAKKEFTSVWYDNFGTGTTIATGTYNDQDSTLNLTGNMFEPGTGSDVKYRETMKFIDNDNQVMTMYVMQDNREVKNMEQVFTRKK
jgi:hypothetical protein